MCFSPAPHAVLEGDFIPHIEVVEEVMTAVMANKFDGSPEQLSYLVHYCIPKCVIYLAKRSYVHYYIIIKLR